MKLMAWPVFLDSGPGPKGPSRNDGEFFRNLLEEFHHRGTELTEENLMPLCPPRLRGNILQLLSSFATYSGTIRPAGP